ncbi:hypothetical protein ACFXC2_14345, partial [Streptomyces lavendulae]
MKLLAAACALVLGGGGVAVVAGNANAGQDSGRTGEVTATIDCPDVGDRLTDVPDQARAEVDQNLAQLDGQVADAYRQLAAGQVSKKKVQKDALLGRLKDQRATTIRRVSDVIGRSAGRPQGLDALSGCTMKEAPAEADPGVGAAADAAVAAAAAPARDPDAARRIGQKRGPAQSDYV